MSDRLIGADHLQWQWQARAQELAHALDALVAERDEWLENCREEHSRAEKAIRRAEAAEAERDAAYTDAENAYQIARGVHSDERNGLVARAEAAEKSREEYIEETIRLRDALFAAEARVTELEAALGELQALIQTRRTSLHMDGTEMFAQPVLAQLNSIARAALAAPTKEDTDE